MKQHGKSFRWPSPPVYVYGTERHGTRSAQGFKGGKSQKLTKKQKRMEAMQKNKSPGVRDECIGAIGCNTYCV